MATSKKRKAQVWGKNRKGGAYEVTVPSGERCLVRRVGIDGLIKAGVLHNLDSLTALVDDQVSRGKGKPPKKVSPEGVAALRNDPEKLTAAFELMDRVVEYVVLEPSVKRPVRAVLNEDGEQVREEPLELDDRDEDQVYTDDIDVEDKTFLFNYVVGGTRDLKTFREQAGELAGSVAAQQGVEATAK